MYRRMRLARRVPLIVSPELRYTRATDDRCADLTRVAVLRHYVEVRPAHILDNSRLDKASGRIRNAVRVSRAYGAYSLVLDSDCSQQDWISDVT